MRTSRHITLTRFVNESRVLRDTETLLHADLVQCVFIVALHAQSLNEE